MKNIITLSVIILILFGGLFFYAKPDQNVKGKGDTAPKETSSISSLEAPETFYDFGTISMENGNVSKTFKVTNSTTGDIFIPKLTTSCMCTSAYLIKPNGSKIGPFGMEGMGFVPKINETIKAGESRDIEVVYDPNAHGPAGVGMIDRLVYLEDSNGEKLQFEIKANVTP